jgi:hypothetical protein
LNEDEGKVVKIKNDQPSVNYKGLGKDHFERLLLQEHQKLSVCQVHSTNSLTFHWLAMV